MPICPREDVPTIVAGSKELLNWLGYRGFSQDQCLQILITLSSSFLSAVCKSPEELAVNVEKFCTLLRHYSGVQAPKKKRRGKAQ